MITKMNVKTAVIATMVGAAALTGAGFGIAGAMTPSHPASSVTHQVDTPTEGDTTSAVDKPEAGDAPDAPGAVDRPEAGDAPDAPGQN